MASASQDVEGILDDFVSSSHRLDQIELQEHFIIVKELGKGGYGKVLLVKDIETGRRMALKILNKNRTSQKTFLQELGISFYLSSHPNIVGCYGSAFKTRDHFVFIQEPAPAGDLHSLIEPNVGIPEDAVKRCAMQLSSALEFMSENGLVHMDIKPENVLVFDQDCHCIKLTDFGLARVRGTVITARAGSTSYMSPEMCEVTVSDGLSVEGTLDVWAFGVVIYCLLMGEFPWQMAITEDEEYKSFVDWQNYFQTDNLPERWSEVPIGILQMFGDLLALDYRQRSRTAEVLKYMNESWKKETLDSSTIEEEEDPIQSNSALQPDEPVCEASQVNAQRASDKSQSSVSITSSLSSVSYHLMTDTSGSPSEITPQKSIAPETLIMFDDEFSFHVGAEVDIG